MISQIRQLKPYMAWNNTETQMSLSWSTDSFVRLHQLQPAGYNFKLCVLRWDPTLRSVPVKDELTRFTFPGIINEWHERLF